MFWKDKIVFITGASSGIGGELGRQLSKRGAILGLLARRKEMLDELSFEIVQNGGIARSLTADVTDKISVDAAAESLRREFGRIDILIANAGIGGKPVHAKDLQPDNFAQVVNINLIGAVNSIASVLPDMFAKNNGQIVGISSLAGYGGLPKSAAYCASKAGMSALFESVRVDLLDTSVKVTTVHPGFIKTPLTSGRAAKMPFLMELSDGVKAITDGIEAGKKNVAFPFPLAQFVRLSRFLPLDLYDYIASKNSYRE
ncbi:MAG: SDR family NAD(P)-dependent oxidoreductase [Pyrinomonadaceae bacterium]|nr:SDR family NAD(P)-dependent oxidoreductase [Pyrinomonadaceae bacterium]